MQVSTGAKKAMLVGAGGMKGALDGGEWRIYSGVMPANPDDSIGSAGLLCTIKNGGSGCTWENVNDIMLSKPAGETWTGTNAGTGVASFFRYVQPGDTGNASSTAVRMQGTVAVVGGDLNIDTASLAAGLDTPIKSYNLSILP